jgi:hypothetical protein
MRRLARKPVTLFKAYLEGWLRVQVQHSGPSAASLQPHVGITMVCDQCSAKRERVSLASR